MMKSRFEILLALFVLLLGVSVVGCPPTPTPDDDDDATDADDDDDDDDDTTPSDDDDTTPPPDYDDCEGPTVTYAEEEPNDGNSEEEVNVIESDGGVIITGEASVCSNDGSQWTGDYDIFLVNWDCGGELTATLRWNEDDPDANTTDMDLYVADAGDNPVIESYNYQPEDPDGNPFPPIEDGTADTGGPHTVIALCWDGPAAEYTITLEWAGGGDDDDSAGDDDDSAGDDDDSGHDDDDSAGDDDDSAGDDDDSAGDDDDSAAGDDDDSAAGDDDDSAAGDDDDSAR